MITLEFEISCDGKDWIGGEDVLCTKTKKIKVPLHLIRTTRIGEVFFDDFHVCEDEWKVKNLPYEKRTYCSNHEYREARK